MRAQRLLLSALVLAGGICAAWPYRQTAPPLAQPGPSDPSLQLVARRTAAPVAANPAGESSPAAKPPSTQDSKPRTELTSLHQAEEERLRLDRSAPPPQLPVTFHSPYDNTTVGSRQTASAAVANTRPRIYYLRDGDTLEKLAERFLGDRQRATEIFEANRGVLKRPDLLPVGITINIPPREQ